MNEAGVAVAAPITDRAEEHIAVWDLSDLYEGPDDPELSEHLDTARREAESFRADYAGRLENLSGAELGQAIARYESSPRTAASGDELCAVALRERYERAGARPVPAEHAGALQ